MADVDGVVSALKAEEPRSIQRLQDWLRIPSVGTDPAHAADTRRAGQWAVDFLQEIGIDARLRETGTKAKPGHPIVWAQHPGSADYRGPHVLFYGHYDVQPPDPLDLDQTTGLIKNGVLRPELNVVPSVGHQKSGFTRNDGPCDSDGGSPVSQVFAALFRDDREEVDTKHLFERTSLKPAPGGVGKEQGTVCPPANDQI